MGKVSPQFESCWPEALGDMPVQGSRESGDRQRAGVITRGGGRRLDGTTRTPH